MITKRKNRQDAGREDMITPERRRTNTGGPKYALTEEKSHHLLALQRIPSGGNNSSKFEGESAIPRKVGVLSQEHGRRFPPEKKKKVALPVRKEASSCMRRKQEDRAMTKIYAYTRDDPAYTTGGAVIR